MIVRARNTSDLPSGAENNASEPVLSADRRLNDTCFVRVVAYIQEMTNRYGVTMLQLASLMTPHVRHLNAVDRKEAGSDFVAFCALIGMRVRDRIIRSLRGSEIEPSALVDGAIFAELEDFEREVHAKHMNARP